MVCAEQCHPGGGRRRDSRRGTRAGRAFLRRHRTTRGADGQAAAGTGRTGRAPPQAAREDAVADIADGVQRPSLATEENARQVHALRLISALLDGGYSARLPERLERGEELVTSASAWYDAYARGDSLFVLSAAPNMQKGRTLEEVEAGLWRELDALKGGATLGGRTRAGSRPGHRRAGVRARFHHPAGHHHRQAGNRRPVLAADGRGAGGARGRHARRHPAGCAQLFHPLAPERRPCSARGSPR